MLRILPWLGKVRIRRFQKRVLVAVPELATERSISWLCRIVLFQCAFGAVLVVLGDHASRLPGRRRPPVPDYAETNLWQGCFSCTRRGKLREKKPMKRMGQVLLAVLLFALTLAVPTGTADARTRRYGRDQHASHRRHHRGHKHHQRHERRHRHHRRG
jgi:hypothetical protein